VMGHYEKIESKTIIGLENLDKGGSVQEGLK